MYEKTLELEDHFQKAASSAIYLIPYSMGVITHDRISACNAIGYDAIFLGNQLVLSLPPLLILACSDSVINLSDSFQP